MKRAPSIFVICLVIGFIFGFYTGYQVSTWHYRGQIDLDDKSIQEKGSEIDALKMKLDNSDKNSQHSIKFEDFDNDPCKLPLMTGIALGNLKNFHMSDMDVSGFRRGITAGDAADSSFKNMHVSGGC